MPNQLDVGHLLYELCVRLGFCLDPDDQARLAEEPPKDVEAFTDAVLVAEGMDPKTVDPPMRAELRALVALHFERET